MENPLSDLSIFLSVPFQVTVRGGLKEQQTDEQVEATKDKVVRFLRDVLGDDCADEVEDESVEEYADRKGITITNLGRRSSISMVNGDDGNGDMTKAELEDCIDSATQILTDAYVLEASREDLAAAIGDALDALADDEDDDDDSGDDKGR